MKRISMIYILIIVMLSGCSEIKKQIDVLEKDNFPEIVSVIFDPDTKIKTNEELTITIKANDPQEKELNYFWNVEKQKGSAVFSGNTMKYQASSSTENVNIELHVSNGSYGIKTKINFSVY